ncbi:MAG: hypothetical protein DWQ34_19755 [Planctomycetota bacterium]|nr:MAG: hypothetical protein DWQ34_19755 [Planctomycetota bacterium]
MAGPKSNSGFHLGFLRVVEVGDDAFAGGLLVTNHLGRPLEFQCTTPVRPNRTQAILYGPTLKPFVWSELIGKTLHARVDVKPQLILVDQPALLELREHVPAPVACLVDGDPRSSELADVTRLQVGRNLLRFHTEFPEDRDIAAAGVERGSADADLLEPLERVTEALRETLRSGSAA